MSTRPSVELEHLMAFAVRAARVGDPEIAFRVDGRTVREDEHARTQRIEQAGAHVVFQDRRSGRRRRNSGSAVNDIDVAVRRCLDAGDSRPFDAGRKFRPNPRRAIGLRQVVLRRASVGGECLDRQNDR